MRCGRRRRSWGCCGVPSDSLTALLRAIGNAADLPLAAIDRVVRTVLVDPGAEAGRAELEGHLKALAEASISVQAKHAPPLPLFPQ